MDLRLLRINSGQLLSCSSTFLVFQAKEKSTKYLTNDNSDAMRLQQRRDLSQAAVPGGSCLTWQGTA